MTNFYYVTVVKSWDFPYICHMKSVQENGPIKSHYLCRANGCKCDLKFSRKKDRDQHYLDIGCYNCEKCQIKYPTLLLLNTHKLHFCINKQYPETERNGQIPVHPPNSSVEVISSARPWWTYKASKDPQSPRPRKKLLVYRKCTRNNVGSRIVVDYLKLKKKSWRMKKPLCIINANTVKSRDPRTSWSFHCCSIKKATIWSTFSCIKNFDSICSGILVDQTGP